MTELKLVPVLEINHSDQEISPPVKFPYWDHFEIWDQYHKECLIKAGFIDNLTPYLKGSSFYTLSDISDNNLAHLTIQHSQEFRNGIYQREDCATFSGGYVLQVNGEDKYFPQCCGELSDIVYWDRLTKGENSYIESHPAPVVKFKEDKVIFDFSVDGYDEPFQPEPPETILIIEKAALKIAVEQAKAELSLFAHRLEKINDEHELNIDNIGGLLIWDDGNYN